MDPIRWQRIEELYHAARECGPAVLEGTDPDLRREVEELLSHDTGGIGDGLTLTQTAESPVGWSGRNVAHYHVLELLGRGGMGEVYKALDTKLERMVALKFLPPHLSQETELKRRLKKEARTASALDHPNIVVVHDIGEAPGGEMFIAMAFHEGVTLREKIRAGLTTAEALRIARQIAAGLEKAHENRIFHRDIKPGNVIVAKDGVARIIDFGLAKSSAGSASMDGSAKGTPLYMSPEQAAGGQVDYRTDLWSLGAVLYEMLAGRPAFEGDSQFRVIHAIVRGVPPRLRDARPDLPAELDRIVGRAMEKDLAKRYQSAAEMAGDIDAVLSAPAAQPRRLALLRPVYAVPGAALIFLAAGAAFWLYQRSENRHWARETAIPQIAALKSKGRPVAALRLLREAEKYLPGDPQLASVSGTVVHTASVRSTPPGALVEVKDYVTPGDAWYSLGTTPLDKVPVPSGYLRWRVTKPGMATYEGAPTFETVHGLVGQFDFPLTATGVVQSGMVPIPATKYDDFVWSLDEVGPYDLPAFYMDRFEVTNRQFRDFVDQGGYRKREYWKEKFVRDGKELSWEQAMELFHDATGRPGPSTWQAGHYPDGRDDYPVGGVSWYEAAAYAEFAGKSLPALAQWFLAAPSGVARYIIGQSNFSGAPAVVGKYQGLGAWGTYDMAGNVAEWCRNEEGGGIRYQLGGAATTSTNEYFEPGGQPPFHRGAESGFRCVRNSAPLPAGALAELHQNIRDFSRARPVSDAVFRIYKGMYAYDHTPLNQVVERVPSESPDWSKEKITFDAAYGGERMSAYLLIPARVKPPYETVVFYPSARVLDIPSSATLGDLKFVDYVIQSGRAVLYPVFKGTYERPGHDLVPDTAAGREAIIHSAKDFGRSLDYLLTRPDIDRGKIAYMGVSMGAAESVYIAAVDDRLKTVIMLDGGFFADKPLEGADQADFAPRIKAPTLLIAGRYDWIFLGKDALVNLLGAPKADKKVVLFETAHDVSEQRPDLIREVLAWLDKYLGRVT